MALVDSLPNTFIAERASCHPQKIGYFSDGDCDAGCDQEWEPFPAAII
jgi:hypothetical protein